MSSIPPILDYAPPPAWYRRWRRTIILSCAITAVTISAALALQVYRDWFKEHRQPSSEGGGSSFNRDRVFQHTGCKVWSTGGRELFYALAMGYGDFEPMIPILTFTYTYNMDAGGTLTINGRKVNYSATKRLLALNPFGEMQEIALSDSEAKVVQSGDAEKIWDHVVLPRLYRFHGEERDGKRVGPWVCFDSTGKKAYEGSYLDGNRDGKWTYFYASGVVRAESAYANGKRQGKWSTFDATGKLTDTLTWNDDDPVERPARQSGLGHTDVLLPNGGSQRSSW